MCPTCREPFESDLHGTEYVQFTATQQWDELLEIAQDWARLDRHGKDDEPEDTEEEELPFIEEDLDESYVILNEKSSSISQYKTDHLSQKQNYQYTIAIIVKSQSRDLFDVGGI